MKDSTSRSYQSPIADDAANEAVRGSKESLSGVENGVAIGSRLKRAGYDIATEREVRYWLEWQSRMISGVISGGIYLATGSADESRKFNEVTWPKTAAHTALLRDMATDTVRAEKPLVRGNVADGSDIIDVVTCPVRQNELLIGAVVFTLSNRKDAQRDSVQQLMQWCVVWLENILESQANASYSAEDAQFEVVNLISAVAPLEVSAYQLCSHLANEFDCSLVALGLRQELSVQAIAVSNQLDFDRRTQGVSEIEFAMEECADQDITISLSPEHSDMNAITQAHQRLLKTNAELVVCSVPVRAENNLIGVMTFVKSDNTPFSREQRYKIDSIVATIGPVLKLQTITNQSLLTTVRQSIADYYKSLLGEKNIKFKTMAGLLLLIPLLLAFVPAEQRVTATASLEGSMQQAIVAPINGYIKTVYARAGDAVTAGQSLVALDDSALALQFEKTSSERDKLASEYQLAWANRDKAQIAIISARLEQSDAQLALVESEMAHNEITAPFDGMLVSGDLSQLSGTPVEQGQLLYELVPLTGFKVILDINEYDVGKLADGQNGVLRLTGSPDKSIEFTIQKAFPIASVRQNQNVFRVEAILQNPPENLRTGMQGVGKISVGDSTIGRVWTQSLRERLKMSAWYFGF